MPTPETQEDQSLNRLDAIIAGTVTLPPLPPRERIHEFVAANRPLRFQGPTGTRASDPEFIGYGRAVCDLCMAAGVSPTLFTDHDVSGILAYHRITFFITLLDRMYANPRIFRNIPKPYRYLIMANHLNSGNVSPLRRSSILASQLHDVRRYVDQAGELWNFLIDCLPNDWEQSEALTYLINRFGSEAADMIFSGADLIAAANNYRDGEIQNRRAWPAGTQQAGGIYERFVGVDPQPTMDGVTRAEIPRPVLRGTWVEPVGNHAEMGGTPIPEPAPAPATVPTPEPPRTEEPIRLTNIQIFHGETLIGSSPDEVL